MARAKRRRVIGRTVTVAEAARLTGLSKRAIEARVERGTLPAELRGHRRMIPLAALYEAGLLHMDAPAVITELLDRIEQQAKRIAELEADLRRRRQ